jgi:hypothetical protein
MTQHPKEGAMDWLLKPRVSKECGVLCFNHPSSFVRDWRLRTHVTALLRKPNHAGENFFGSDSIGRYPEAAAFFQQETDNSQQEMEMEVVKCGRN